MARSNTELTRDEPIVAEEFEQKQLAQILLALREGELEIRAGGVRLSTPDPLMVVLEQAAMHLAAGHAVSLDTLHKDLTPQHAAELLGVSRPFVVKLIETGELSGYRVGSHRRIPLEDVFAYMRRRDTERRRAHDSLITRSARRGSSGGRG